MVSKIVNNKTFEYDEDKYEIEYSQRQGIIILKKRCNNEILKVFDDNTMFILEYNNKNNDTVNFLVGVRSKSCSNKGKLYHFIEDDNKLITFLTSKLDNVDLNSCRVSDNTFVTREGRCSNKYVFYNVEKGISHSFDSLIINDEVEELFGPNKAFVKEIRNPNLDSNGFTDTLTYLIDTDSYNICSLIWSDLEQRFIKVYSLEEIECLKDKHEDEFVKEGININLNENLEELTKKIEVDRYIKILNCNLESPDIIKDKKVNKAFALKFLN